MSKPPSLPRDLQTLLDGVSRSFGLTLKLLPAPVRPVISLAYLLARAADTLADAAQVPVFERQQALRAWLNAIERAEPASVSAHTEVLTTRLKPYLQSTLSTSEHALLQQLPLCLHVLSAMPDIDQTHIRAVMEPIGQGQLDDLERGLHGLATLRGGQDLDLYTWQVAGCVGRFWTQCLQTHLPHTLGLPASEMLTLGQHYGQGLQKLNILLDAAEDLQNGRCYFPVESLQALGLTPTQLQQARRQGDEHTLAQLQPLQTQWIADVELALRDGLRYSCALSNGRLRLASALPALIGAASLALLRTHLSRSLCTRLKWPRTALWGTLLWVGLQGSRPRALQSRFEHLLRQSRP